VVANDETPATGAAPFIYRDVLNLASPQYVSDDGPLTSLTWSYTSAGRYRFNGATPLVIGTDSPVTPPAAKVINSAANISATGESNPDNDPFTPTIRDVILTPFTGAATDPPGTGIVASEVVTLFASDGTTAGMNDMVVYSDDGGADRLSATPPPGPVNVYSVSFASGPNGWTQGAAFGATLTSVNGLCISVPATGNNIGEWVSPYNIFPLVDNGVYRIRLTMSTNQNTALSVPFWDMYIQNLATAPATPAGDFGYGGDYYFLDNTGSANAVAGPATGLNQFDIYYAPLAFRTAQWKSTTTGAFNPALDADNDARVVFRILDADDAPIQAQNDSGQICLTNIVIERFDFDNVIEGAQVASLNPFTQGINGVTVDDIVEFSNNNGGGSNRDFATNPLTLTPQDPAGWLLELTSITPGDVTNPTLGTPAYGDGSSIIDNYPINWESNTLYMATVMTSAPNATAETNGPDAFRIGFDAKTIELLSDNIILSGLTNRPGMPKQGAPQPYTAFFWSHNRSLETAPEAARLRWRIDVLNSDTYNRPAGVTRNLGGIRFHSVEVRKVTFPAM
jgi:hypothetical protein